MEQHGNDRYDGNQMLYSQVPSLKCLDQGEFDLDKSTDVQHQQRSEVHQQQDISPRAAIGGGDAKLSPLKTMADKATQSTIIATAIKAVSAIEDSMLFKEAPG